eukprot:CAMPEP_0172474942 /NCGR_PEP_ID=MMETSP1065-20121228/69616_1 /TAXON_ID=265537 /ORGANISM="Amphiprora paludosa, Strain CCMP125" /LENGTH=1070 /DNA_ID=CAMNT_0013233135 /DNA_START=32 /DNA_END=3247 /DNA_ORIENTATION=+
MAELVVKSNGHSYLQIGSARDSGDLRGSSLPSISEQKPLTMKRLKFDNLGLYGRGDERSDLKRCIARLVKGETSTEAVFIDGNSGTGKTALALSMKEEVKRVGGALVVGNHDFALREEPYSAVAAACQELCKEVKQSLDTTQFDRLQQEMFQDFDALDLSLLHDIIPATNEIAPVLDDIETVYMENVKSEDKKARLLLAFKKFIRIMSSIFCPLVIVLDDLQWADSSSLELLKTISLAQENKNLMIIGTYRSNEVFSSHGLAKLLAEMRNQADEKHLMMSEVPLGNLPIREVNQYIMDLLSLQNVSESMPLAQLCFKRTFGNPFFVKTFLSMLNEVSLMDYNNGEWGWDMEAIERVSTVTKNVSDFLKDRIKRSCKGDIVDLLLFSACLGNIFEEKHLVIIWEATNKSIPLRHVLDEAVEQLFFEPVSNSQYRFVHSAVKEAAISLVSKSDFDKLKHSIGRILFDSLGDDCPERMIFVLANLLNNNSRRDPSVAELNLKAATRAKELAAFSSAAAYAMEGIKKLPGSSLWDKHMQLTVDLHSVGAEAERCAGNIIQAKIYCSTVLQQKNVPTFAKLRVHTVMIDMLEQGNQMKEALNYCLDALDNIGCSFPRGSMGQTLQAALTLKKAKTPKYIPDNHVVESLAPMINKEKRHGMELLEAASSSAYFSGNKILVFLLCFKRIKWTIHYGLHPSSPSAFAVLAGIFMHAFGDWERGQALANLSLSTLNKVKEMGEKVCEPKTLCRVNFFVLTWTQTPQSMLEPLKDTYKSGMRHGDVDSACKTLVWLVHCELFSGKSLQSVEEGCRPRVAEIEDLKYEKWAKVFRLAWQSILNLMGASANTIVLTGAAVNEQDILAESVDSFAKLHLVHFYKRYLCTFFGEYEEGAEDSIKHGEQFMKTFPGAFFGFDSFHRGMCLYGAARTTKQTKYRKQAEKIRSTIKAWVEKGAPNHAHQLSILNAEHAALIGGGCDEVSALYEKAISEASSGGFIQNAALAEERFGEYLKEVDEELESLNHLKEAIRLYSKWGAMKKVELLQEKHGHFLLRRDSSFRVKGTGVKGRSWACECSQKLV